VGFSPTALYLVPLTHAAVVPASLVRHVPHADAGSVRGRGPQRAQALASWVAMSEAKRAGGDGWDQYEAALYASLRQSSRSLKQQAASHPLSQPEATAEEQLKDWTAECLAEAKERSCHNEFMDNWLRQALQSSESAAERRRRRRRMMLDGELSEEITEELETTELFDAELDTDFDEVRWSIGSSTDHPPSERGALHKTVKLSMHSTTQPSPKTPPLRPGQIFGSGNKGNFTGPERKDTVLRQYLQEQQRSTTSTAPDRPKGPLHDSARDDSYPNMMMTL
jgi:hypothetical protein